MGTKQNSLGNFVKAKSILKLALGVGIFAGLTTGQPGFRWQFIPFDGFSRSVSAQELPGGISFFAAPPQLAESSTTFDGVSIPTPKYYFTIALPDDAGAGLASVVFQSQASPDPINFYPDRTEAFVGDRPNLGQSIPLQTTLWDRSTGRLTVSFAEPVAPGQTVTIRLIPVRNPNTPGVYQFRLFALPPGDQAQSMDLGVARFQFYRGTW